MKAGIETIYIFTNLSSSLVYALSHSEEEAQSNSETSEKSVKEDDAGVKSYNEKFQNLICTNTDVIQQIM